jgi:hypothetical protein
LGRIIKEIRFRKFGAQFGDTFTLLDFGIRQQEPRYILMDLQWHVADVRTGCAVFIHFVDREGSVCFQGDYSMDGEIPDSLGFAYSRRSVVVPGEIASGAYRVRLGVWSPAARQHLSLERFRSCDRELPGHYYNSVLLKSIAI